MYGARHGKPHNDAGAIPASRILPRTPPRASPHTGQFPSPTHTKTQQDQVVDGMRALAQCFQTLAPSAGTGAISFVHIHGTNIPQPDHTSNAPTTMPTAAVPSVSVSMPPRTQGEKSEGVVVTPTMQNGIQRRVGADGSEWFLVRGVWNKNDRPEDAAEWNVAHASYHSLQLPPPPTGARYSPKSPTSPPPSPLPDPDHDKHPTATPISPTYTPISPVYDRAGPVYKATAGSVKCPLDAPQYSPNSPATSPYSPASPGASTSRTGSLEMPHEEYSPTSPQFDTNAGSPTHDPMYDPCDSVDDKGRRVFPSETKRGTIRKSHPSRPSDPAADGDVPDNQYADSNTLAAMAPPAPKRQRTVADAAKQMKQQLTLSASTQRLVDQQIALIADLKADLARRNAWGAEFGMLACSSVGSLATGRMPTETTGLLYGAELNAAVSQSIAFVLESSHLHAYLVEAQASHMHMRQHRLSELIPSRHVIVHVIRQMPVFVARSSSAVGGCRYSIVCSIETSLDAYKAAAFEIARSRPVCKQSLDQPRIAFDLPVGIMSVDHPHDVWSCTGYHHEVSQINTLFGPRAYWRPPSMTDRTYSVSGQLSVMVKVQAFAVFCWRMLQGQAFANRPGMAHSSGERVTAAYSFCGLAEYMFTCVFRHEKAKRVRVTAVPVQVGACRLPLPVVAQCIQDRMDVTHQLLSPFLSIMNKQALDIRTCSQVAIARAAESRFMDNRDKAAVILYTTDAMDRFGTSETEHALDAGNKTPSLRTVVDIAADINKLRVPRWYKADQTTHTLDTLISTMSVNHHVVAVYDLKRYAMDVSTCTTHKVLHDNEGTDWMAVCIFNNRGVTVEAVSLSANRAINLGIGKNACKSTRCACFRFVCCEYIDRQTNTPRTAFVMNRAIFRWMNVVSQIMSRSLLTMPAGQSVCGGDQSDQDTVTLYERTQITDAYTWLHLAPAYILKASSDISTLFAAGICHQTEQIAAAGFLLDSLEQLLSRQSQRAITQAAAGTFAPGAHLFNWMHTPHRERPIIPHMREDNNNLFHKCAVMDEAIGTGTVKHELPFGVPLPTTERTLKLQTTFPVVLVDGVVLTADDSMMIATLPLHSLIHTAKDNIKAGQIIELYDQLRNRSPLPESDLFRVLQLVFGHDERLFQGQNREYGYEPMTMPELAV